MFNKVSTYISEIPKTAEVEMFKSLTAERMAELVETFCINDTKTLNHLLGILSVKNSKEMFEIVGSFFRDELKIEQIIPDLENQNFREIAYRFVAYAKIPLPLLKTELEKDEIRQFIEKLARVVIHEVIIPELERINPGMAKKVQEIIIRTIEGICRIEKQNSKRIIRALDLSVKPSKNGIRNSKNNKVAKKPIQLSEFYVCNFSKEEAKEIGKLLHEDYEAIQNINAFVNFLFSHGRKIHVVKCNPNKIKLIICLLSKLQAEKNSDGEYLLEMNSGKGWWKFSQKNLVKYDGEEFGRIRSIIPSMNKKPLVKENIRVTQEVKDIFKIVFKDKGGQNDIK